MPTTNEMRDLMESVTRRILRDLKPSLDFLKQHNIGVTVFAFGLTPDTGPEPSAIAYLSTANRADMIASIKEWLAYQEAGLATEPRGERGRG